MSLGVDSIKVGEDGMSEDRRRSFQPIRLKVSKGVSQQKGT